MRQLFFPIASLLLSNALFLTGHGLILTILPLRAQLVGFSATEIALTGSSYFAGFVLGCITTPHIVRRVGHIRCYAVLASLVSALVLCFHHFPSFAVWLLLRFLLGSCVSGLHMTIESWLNDRASKETRGTVLSVYTMINLGMITLGQQLINFAEPSSGQLFGMASILLSLAIVPVSLTVTLAPAPMQAVKLDLRKLWRISHVGMGGAMCCGLVTGAFWSLGPIYAQGIGLDAAGLSLFMSAVVVGGALFQLPLGRLSDHYDRRLVLFFSTLFGAGISLALAFNSGGQLSLLLALFWGGSVMTLYAICLAHASDSATPDEFVMVGSGILFVLGVCSAIGAPIASGVMSLFGPGGLFLYSGSCLLLFAFGISRRRKSHVLPVVDETEPFIPMAATSPAAFEMDPRTEEHADKSANNENGSAAEPTKPE
ncbi:arabinose efflux permease family protein [Spongiibacter sp. IMCC21906]|uniref:MFS transporter n=1 Tax=Spongiibacter sp. IMCC21906 TaxID=1620392 RepID=UPI00062DDFCA|nr:MFS transporter [Spongiibacter sp. IMCC21906]AKH70002.1 arabinose efflux permease family protein [Spongiibacter sp. IMCC21906]